MSNTRKVSLFRTPQFELIAESISKTGRFLAERGWSPATSSNYSVRLDAQSMAITRTGVDKSEMTEEDVILVDLEGKVIAPKTERPSAETLIHTAVYKQLPAVGSVLHTHSPYSTRLSLKYLNDGKLVFKGYEIQKALSGFHTHESELVLPIVNNTQDMVTLSKHVEDMVQTDNTIVGFLLAGHGLYTWAKDLRTAKRHVEALEFLFECRALELSGV